MLGSPTRATGLSTHKLTHRAIVVVAVTFFTTLLIWSSNRHDSYSLEIISFTPRTSSIIPFMKNVTKVVEPIVEWVSVYRDLERNYTSKLISRCYAKREGVSSNASSTVVLKFLNIDDGKPIVLSTGNAHEVFFQVLDKLGNSFNYGGDYFDINLVGERWRSRPPSRDIDNGTYSFILQVHPDFAGDYNLTITLVYRNCGGLRFILPMFVYDKQLRNIPILFLRSEVTLQELRFCKKVDFNRGFWAGRWTRLAKNNTCEISEDGRYRCLEPNHPCMFPWCNGSLGMLESNGWVYSAHCSFKLFSTNDAWRCLNNRWLFFWGDSTMVDTVRNMLFFNLGVPLERLDVINRHFDRNFTNPDDMSQSVRITHFWNGHFNVSESNFGLRSFTKKKYRDSLISSFNRSVVPDTILFNSGIHDGFSYGSLYRYSADVDMAISFWKRIIEGVKKRGLEIPNFIFRSTSTNYIREHTVGTTPSKMEAYNWILLEKLRDVGLITGVIDYFDMTWPWHYNLRCTDGLHYGRFPSKRKWKDGQNGHQYFVDLMLGHVILNAICPK